MTTAHAIHVETHRLKFLLVTAAFAVVAGVLVSALRPTLEAALLLAIGVLVTAPLLYRRASGRFDVFEPLTVFVAVFGTLFFVVPLVMYVDPSSVPSHLADFGIHEALAPLLVAVLLAGGAFLFGYFGPLARAGRGPLPPPNPDWDPTSVLLPAVLWAAFGLLLFSLFVSTAGGLEALKDFLGGRTAEQRVLLREIPSYLFIGITFLVPASLLLLTPGLTGRSRPELAALVIVIVLLLVFWGVPTGRRSTLLLAFIPFAVLFYLRRDKRPSFWLAVAAAPLLILVLAGLGNARPQNARSESGFLDLAVQPFFSPVDTMQNVFRGNNTAVSAYLALTLEVVPERLHFEYGRATGSDLAVRAVPRRLWPGKPLPPKDKIVSELWPNRFARGSANPAFSPIAMFYYDFGWPGIAVGMWAYGSFFRMAYEYFQRNRGHVAVQVLYASILTVFMLSFKKDPVSTLVLSASIQGPLLISFWATGLFKPMAPRQPDAAEEMADTGG